VTVGAGVMVAVGDGVLVPVGVGVLVTVGDGVLVSVGVGVMVTVGDGVLVLVGVAVSVSVGASVWVGVAVAAGVGVLVGSGARSPGHAFLTRRKAIAINPTKAIAPSIAKSSGGRIGLEGTRATTAEMLSRPPCWLAMVTSADAA
jgi:hypothetical protein